MSKRFMRDGLQHKYSGLKYDEFFSLIGATGGWPLGYQYVGFVHSDKREAGFCNASTNDGWWTVVASADDYYLWKLSPEALQRITDAAVERAMEVARTIRPDASKLWIKTWRGHKAVLGLGKENGHG